MIHRLEARGLYRFYHAGDDETVALKGVDFTVEAGELVAVMGPSGSGKSTLLACLAGLDEPDAGTVLVDGITLSRRPEAERTAIRAQHIGVLFQSQNLLDAFTVAENVELAQRLAGRRDASAADALLDRLGVAQRAQSLPHELSGGESARAGLAVALANAPSVILADEPTGELDSRTADIVTALLHGQATSGATVVVVTHNEAFARAADRQVRLHDGALLR